MLDKMQALIEILSRTALVPAGEIRPDSDLFDELEIDSLCLLETFLLIEQKFGKKLRPSDLNRKSYQTPRKLLELIEGAARADQSRP